MPCARATLDALPPRASDVCTFSAKCVCGLGPACAQDAHTSQQVSEPVVSVRTTSAQTPVPMKHRGIPRCLLLAHHAPHHSVRAPHCRMAHEQPAVFKELQHRCAALQQVQPYTPEVQAALRTHLGGCELPQVGQLSTGCCCHLQATVPCSMLSCRPGVLLMSPASCAIHLRLVPCRP